MQKTGGSASRASASATKSKKSNEVVCSDSERAQTMRGTEEEDNGGKRSKAGKISAPPAKKEKKGSMAKKITKDTAEATGTSSTETTATYGSTTGVSDEIDAVESSVFATEKGEIAPENGPSDQTVAGRQPRKKFDPSAKARFLKAVGIGRPQTAFQLWGAFIKDDLMRDIETKTPPEARKEAFVCAHRENGRCDLNRYRSLLWKSTEDGGFGYLSDEERAKWDAEYQKGRNDWESRKETALMNYPTRPKTAYLVFYTEAFIPVFRQNNPTATLKEMTKAASAEWEKNKDTDEFQIYRERAATLRAEYGAKSEAFKIKYPNLFGENGSPSLSSPTGAVKEGKIRKIPVAKRSRGGVANVEERENSSCIDKKNGCTEIEEEDTGVVQTAGDGVSEGEIKAVSPPKRSKKTSVKATKMSKNGKKPVDASCTDVENDGTEAVNVPPQKKTDESVSGTLSDAEKEIVLVKTKKQPAKKMSKVGSGAHSVGKKEKHVPIEPCSSLCENSACEQPVDDEQSVNCRAPDPSVPGTVKKSARGAKAQKTECSDAKDPCTKIKTTKAAKVKADAAAPAGKKSKQTGGKSSLRAKKVGKVVGEMIDETTRFASEGSKVAETGERNAISAAGAGAVDMME